MLCNKEEVSRNVSQYGAHIITVGVVQRDVRGRETATGHRLTQVTVPVCVCVCVLTGLPHSGWELYPSISVKESI